jgi:hypothetical protein
MEGLDFLSAAMEASSAVYSDAFLEKIGVGGTIISNYKNAVESKNAESIGKFHETFKDWRKDYEIANSAQAKAEHELVVMAAEKLAEDYNKQIEE